MTKVLVLYYSSYGHIEKMAGAVAEGVREAVAARSSDSPSITLSPMSGDNPRARVKEYALRGHMRLQ
jgi:multimeric flavodoxin WrbA